MSQASNLPHTSISKRATKNNIQEEGKNSSTAASNKRKIVHELVISSPPNNTAAQRKEIHKKKAQRSIVKEVLVEAQLEAKNDESSSSLLEDYSSKTLQPSLPVLVNSNCAMALGQGGASNTISTKKDQTEYKPQNVQEETAECGVVRKRNSTTNKKRGKVKVVKDNIELPAQKLKSHSNISSNISLTLLAQKSRRNKQSTTSCPICHKVFNRGVSCIVLFFPLNIFVVFLVWT